MFFSFLFNPMIKIKKPFTNMLPPTFKTNSKKIVDFPNKKLIKQKLNPLIIDIGSTTLVIYGNNLNEYTLLNIIILPTPIAQLIIIATTNGIYGVGDTFKNIYDTGKFNKFNPPITI